MQIKNIAIFSSTVPADGAWIDVSNLVALSVEVTGVESNTWIEVSNDPNVNIDNSTSQIAAPSAPVLGQVTYGNLTGQGTYYVKTTYVTKNGETTASSESSLAVSDLNNLVVNAPAPDSLGLATGWNVYISKSSGTEVLQTTPPYTPAATMNASPGYSYATSGVLPLTQNFILVNGFLNSGVVPPSTNTGGGASIGLNITGDLSVSGASPAEMSVFYDTVNHLAMVNPSCLSWKWLRVRKSGGSTRLTTGYLLGQAG